MLSGASDSVLMMGFAKSPQSEHGKRYWALDGIVAEAAKLTTDAFSTLGGWWRDGFIQNKRVDGSAYAQDFPAQTGGN